MARPLHDRTAVKPLRLDVRPRRGGAVVRNSRPWWGIVAAGLAALTVVGGVVLVVRPSGGAGPTAPQTAARSAESVRKVQAVRPAEVPARPAVAVATGVAASPTAGDPRPEPSRTAGAAPSPAEGPPTLMASIGPVSDQPRPPGLGSAPDTRAAPDVEAAGAQAVPASAPKGAVATTAAAPLDCVPGELRAVLADVAARFGAVSVVSTHRVNSDNHTPGTIRHTLHASCRAVDFKAGGNVNEVLAYLRSRKEVGGINSYRNGLIHIDLAGNVRAAALRPRARPAVAVE